MRRLWRRPQRPQLPEAMLLLWQRLLLRLLAEQVARLLLRLLLRLLAEPGPVEWLLLRLPPLYPLAEDRLLRLLLRLRLLGEPAWVVRLRLLRLLRLLTAARL